VAKKQKRVKAHEAFAKGDQYTFVALASASRAIVGYASASATWPIQRISSKTWTHVLGSPEISTDGFTPYQPAIRDDSRPALRPADLDP
jgi:hypothetical protein